MSTRQNLGFRLIEQRRRRAAGFTPFSAAFNFRSTAGYVTDNSGQTAVLAEAYPHTYTLVGGGTVVAGWASGHGSPGKSDRSNTVDVRLAGYNSQLNSGAQAWFLVDLPAPGTYAIRLAAGDATAPQNYQYLQFLDGATVLFTIDDTNGTGGGHFDDATGADYLYTAWPAGNLSVSVTVAGTQLKIVMGAPAAQVNSSTIAHLSVVRTA